MELVKKYLLNNHIRGNKIKERGRKVQFTFIIIIHFEKLMQ